MDRPLIRIALINAYMASGEQDPAADVERNSESKTGAGASFAAPVLISM
jgi:hypothetical protein